MDRGRRVHCYRCVRDVRQPLDWDATYEWASAPPNDMGQPFQRSIHMLVVDAGDCGACLNEVRQLNNPYYNMHRLGFFITPTPRHADVLLVVGPVTDQMRVALTKVYEAMPTPKRVVAVGACALSAGSSRGVSCAQTAWQRCCRSTSQCPGIHRPRLPSCTACWWRLDARGRRHLPSTQRLRRSAEWTRTYSSSFFFQVCGDPHVLSLMLRPAYQCIVLARHELPRWGCGGGGRRRSASGSESFTRLLWTVARTSHADAASRLALGRIRARFRAGAHSRVDLRRQRIAARSLPLLKRRPSRCCCLRSMPLSFWS